MTASVAGGGNTKMAPRRRQTLFQCWGRERNHHSDGHLGCTTPLVVSSSLFSLFFLSLSLPFVDGPTIYFLQQSESNGQGRGKVKGRSTTTRKSKKKRKITLHSSFFFSLCVWWATTTYLVHITLLCADFSFSLSFVTDRYSSLTPFFLVNSFSMYGEKRHAQREKNRPTTNWQTGHKPPKLTGWIKQNKKVNLGKQKRS